MMTSELLPILEFQGTDFKSYNDLVDYVEKQSIENLPQMELPITHRFAPGQYSREMFATTGTLLTSKIHAKEHFFFLMKGKILVIEEDSTRIISAPFHGISTQSARRIGVVIEDVIWITVHSSEIVKDKEYSQNEMIDLIGKIEEEVIIPHTNKLLEA